MALVYSKAYTLQELQVLAAAAAPQLQCGAAVGTPVPHPAAVCNTAVADVYIHIT